MTTSATRHAPASGSATCVMEGVKSGDTNTDSGNDSRGDVVQLSYLYMIAVTFGYVVGGWVYMKALDPFKPTKGRYASFGRAVRYQC